MRIIVLTALSLAFIVAQPIKADENERYTRRQLHKLMREADTPEKQQRVSAYCQRVAKDLKMLAQAERASATQNGTQIQAGSSKYPNQSDSARSRGQHYAYEAARMQKLADKYRVEHNLPAQSNIKAKTDPAYTDVEQQLLKRIDGLEEQIRSLKSQPAGAQAPKS